MHFARAILILLCWQSSASLAESVNAITLTVLQKGTGLPVPDATLAFPEIEKYDSTDEQGRVTFTDVGLPQPLKVMAMGYDQSELLLDSIDRNTIYLTPLSLEDSSVRITGERIPQKASKLILESSEIKFTPGTLGDPLKSLHTLPGVVPLMNLTGQVYIRGSSTADNLVWIDRTPVGYLYHLGGLNSTINPVLVENFNLFLGGFPVNYSDRLGGVIDVQLRAPSRKHYFSHVNMSLLEAGAVVEGPLPFSGGRGSFSLAGRRSHIDLYVSADQVSMQDDELQIVTMPKYYDTQAKFNYRTRGGNFALNYFSAGDELAAFSNASNETKEIVGSIGANTSYKSAGFQWKQSWNKKFSHDISVSLMQSSDQFDLGQHRTRDERYYIDNRTDTLRLQPELTRHLGEGSALKFGVETTYTEFPVELFSSTPPTESKPDFNYSTASKYRVDDFLRIEMQAPYIAYQEKLSNRLNMIFGFRYSEVTGLNNEIFTQDFTTRIATEYQISPKFMATASWGEYIQLPNQLELIDGYGNPTLEFTKAEHRIAGIRYQHTPLWNVQLEAYHKPMSNLVVNVDQSNPPENFVNEGEGEAYGFEVFIKRKRKNRTMGWLSYSYSRSFRQDNITAQRWVYSGDQPHTLTLVWSQPLPGWLRKIEWGITMQAHSGKPYTPLVTTREVQETDGDILRTRVIPIYGTINSERLPNYFRTDMRFSQRILFNRWHMQIYLELQNITNRRNVIAYDYGRTYEFINQPREIVGLPFFPFLGFEATF
jgi:hypothetical protein